MDIIVGFFGAIFAGIGAVFTGLMDWWAWLGKGSNLWVFFGQIKVAELVVILVRNLLSKIPLIGDRFFS